MKSNSLQAIEDFYFQKGLRGDNLRRALEKDTEYQHILKKRKEALKKKFTVTGEEEAKYLLSTDEDYEILGKIKELEKLNLSPEDRSFVVFLRTQIGDDWRPPIIEQLNRLLAKYE